MKNLLYICLFVSLATQAFSQSRYFDERYIFNQSFVNPVLVNPGAIAQSGYHNVLLTYRNKWATFEGSPKSFALSYDGDLGNRLGIGAMVLSDRNGALETVKGQLGLSYTIESDINKLGIGLTGEVIQHSLNASVLNDDMVNENDPHISNRYDGVNFFDLSVGLFGEYQEKFVYGLAFPSLVNSMFDTKTTEEYEKTFGFLVQLGYKLKMPEYDIVATPSIVVKQLMGVPFHVDINALGEFLDQKLTGGLTYTVGADERLGFLIGARVNAFNFYYSYNVSRHEFQQYNNGSHEVTLRFDIGKTDKKKMVDEKEMN